MDYSLAGFKLQVIQQGRLFIAYSHTLDISTTGKTEAEAVERFGSMIHIFMKEVIKYEAKTPGVFTSALTALGWTKRSSRWSPPTSKVALAD